MVADSFLRGSAATQHVFLDLRIGSDDAILSNSGDPRRREAAPEWPGDMPADVSVIMESVMVTAQPLCNSRQPPLE